MENPGWYTPYTPYQAEIAQGRLESLLNFQTMVSDLTGMAVANASLLDEATAAAEALTLLRRVHTRKTASTFLVSDRVFPQTIAVLQSRAKPLGLIVRVVEAARAEFSPDVFGLLLQYPDEAGRVEDLAGLIEGAMRPGSSWRSRRICWHWRCSRRPARWAPTWSSETHNGSGCRSDTA